MQAPDLTVLNSKINALLTQCLEQLETGCLYLVAVPIGNLGDISLRALATLAAVDVIACEDTRVTALLLSQYGLHRPLISWHSYNEKQRQAWLVEKLAAQQKVALVSDAGMPLISDPGGLAVQAVLEAGFKVTTIPGANAALTALCSSGLAADKFTFYGFLPRKGRLRTHLLQQLKYSDATTLIYESPLRIQQLIADLEAHALGEREIVLARELTKRYETFWRGKIADLQKEISNLTLKGEFVVLVAGGKGDQPLDRVNYDLKSAVTPDFLLEAEASINANEMLAYLTQLNSYQWQELNNLPFLTLKKVVTTLLGEKMLRAWVKDLNVCKDLKLTEVEQTLALIYLATLTLKNDFKTINESPHLKTPEAVQKNSANQTPLPLELSTLKLDQNCTTKNLAKKLLLIIPNLHRQAAYKLVVRYQDLLKELASTCC